MILSSGGAVDWQGSTKDLYRYVVLHKMFAFFSKSNGTNGGFTCFIVIGL